MLPFSGHLLRQLASWKHRSAAQPCMCQRFSATIHGHQKPFAITVGSGDKLLVYPDGHVTFLAKTLSTTVPPTTPPPTKATTATADDKAKVNVPVCSSYPANELWKRVYMYKSHSVSCWSVGRFVPSNLCNIELCPLELCHYRDGNIMSHIHVLWLNSV